MADDAADAFTIDVFLPDLAHDWAECSKRKFHGYDFLSGGQPGGTILAVDGYVQPILPPSEKDLKGMNRKIFGAVKVSQGSPTTLV